MKQLTLSAFLVSAMMCQSAYAERVAVWKTGESGSKRTYLFTDCGVMTDLRRSRPNQYGQPSIEFYIETTQVQGSVPLYQFFKSGFQLLSTSEDAGGDKSWSFFNRFGYIYLQPGPGLEDVFQFVWSDSGIHEYTSNYLFTKHVRENREGGPDSGHGYNLPWGLLGRAPASGNMPCDPRLPIPSGNQRPSGPVPRPVPGCVNNGCGTPSSPGPGGITFPFPGG